MLKSNGDYQSNRLSLESDVAASPGEPILQFIKLKPMSGIPEPADMNTKFMKTDLSASGTWAGTVWLDNSGNQSVVTADAQNVHLPNGVNLPYPGGGKNPGLHGVLGLDVNYDLRTDLLLAGAGRNKALHSERQGKVC